MIGWDLWYISALIRQGWEDNCRQVSQDLQHGLKAANEQGIWLCRVSMRHRGE